MGITYLAEDETVDIGVLEDAVISGDKIRPALLPVNPEAKEADKEEGEEELEAVLPLPSDSATQPFVPVGIGKPLSVRIHTVYPGRMLHRRRREGPMDILVVSGLKAEQTFDKTSRIINLLAKQVDSREYIEFSAFQNGSPVVYYTPALTDAALFCSFEIVPDTFNDGLFNKISNLFQMAGGLPIFAPAGTYLMAGSFLTKMFGDLGRAFLEKGPVLSETMRLSFGIGGVINFKEGMYIVHNIDHQGEFANLRPTLGSGNEIVLAHADGRPYKGNAPYLVVGVDGRRETQLENLTQQTASAAMLEDFYPKEDSGGVLINEFGEALQLLNDLKYKKKAEDLEKRLKSIPEGEAGDQQREEFQQLIDAYQANIVLDEFKDD